MLQTFRNTLLLVLIACPVLAEQVTIAVIVQVDVYPFSSYWAGPVLQTMERDLASQTVNGWGNVVGLKNQLLFANWSTTPTRSTPKLTLRLREHPDCTRKRGACDWVIAPTLEGAEGATLQPIDVKYSSRELYLPVLSAPDVQSSAKINRDSDARARADVAKWFLATLEKMLKVEESRNKFIRTALGSLAVARKIGRLHDTDKALVVPEAELNAKRGTEFFAFFDAKPPTKQKVNKQLGLSYVSFRDEKNGIECNVDEVDGRTRDGQSNYIRYLEHPIRETVAISLRTYIADCTRKKDGNVTVDKKGCR
jgi:hypothetical protein